MLTTEAEYWDLIFAVVDYPVTGETDGNRSLLCNELWIVERAGRNRREYFADLSRLSFGVAGGF